MTELVVTLGGAALAALGGVHLWRQRRAAAPGDAIQLVTSRYLGGRRFLAIVEVDGERLLLGVSDERVSLVARLRGAPDGDAGEALAAPERPAP